MKKYQTVWGKRIRELLKEHDMKQDELANAIATYNNEKPRPSTISDWINKGSKPNRKNIEALAFIFEVTPGYITGEISKEENDRIIKERKALAKTYKSNTDKTVDFLNNLNDMTSTESLHSFIDYCNNIGCGFSLVYDALLDTPKQDSLNEIIIGFKNRIDNYVKYEFQNLMNDIKTTVSE